MLTPPKAREKAVAAASFYKETEIRLYLIRKLQSIEQDNADFQIPAENKSSIHSV